jgi:hypothetical protein
MTAAPSEANPFVGYATVIPVIQSKMLLNHLVGKPSTGDRFQFSAMRPSQLKEGFLALSCVTIRRQPSLLGL